MGKHPLLPCVGALLENISMLSSYVHFSFVTTNPFKNNTSYGSRVLNLTFSGSILSDLEKMNFGKDDDNRYTRKKAGAWPMRELI